MCVSEVMFSKKLYTPFVYLSQIYGTNVFRVATPLIGCHSQSNYNHSISDLTTLTS